MMNPINRIITGVLTVCLAAQPIISNAYTPGQCIAIPNSQSCIDATPCKTSSSGFKACLFGVPLPPGAVSLAKSCWQLGYQFACTTIAQDTCGAFQGNPDCGLTKSTCQSINPLTGQCTTYDNTYSCKTANAVSSSVLQCGPGLFTDLPPDPHPTDATSFVRAATGLEMIREISTYNKGANQIFSGVEETCRQGYLGLQDCCKSAPGGQSNSMVFSAATGVAGSALKYAGGALVDLASPYVFDAMFAGGEFTAGLVATFASNDYVVGQVAQSGELEVGTNFASNGLSLSAFGFTYGASASAIGAAGGTASTGLLGANTELATFGADGLGQSAITFNPYVFGATVAIMVIASLASCTDDERMLSLHRGANLSADTYTQCTQTWPIVGCVQDTKHYCSFNSVLAKIINMQGKPQLGLNPNDCTGLTVTQLGQLDFSAIDFTEFSSLVTARSTQFQPTNMPGNYTPIMQSTTGGSQQKNSPALPGY